MKTTSLSVLLIAALFCFAVREASAQTSCSDFTTCTSCITNDVVFSCGWCASDGTCRTNSAMSSCVVNRRINPLNGLVGSTFNAEINPIAATIRLRKGVNYNHVITVNVPTRKEIELNYIFDLSGSMWDDLSSVQALGSALQTRMEILCSGTNPASGGSCAYFQLGQFVDKPMSNFGSGTATSGDYTYALGNGYFDYNFSNNFNTFTAALNAAQVRWGDNYPESQTEAMLQAIVCSNWASNRRHILLLATDATYNYEGDGLRPSATANHMQRRGSNRCYSAQSPNPLSSFTLARVDERSRIYDFPSLSMIRSELIQKNVIPIFAVSPGPHAFQFYQDFVDYLGFGGVGQLAFDSSNVLDVVTNAYLAVAGQVSAQTVNNGQGRFVRNIVPSTGYTGLTPGQSAPFTFTLRDDAETSSLSVATPVQIIFIGYSTASITIQRAACDSAICTAACSGRCQSPNFESCECGRCICKDGYIGDRCDCLATIGTCSGGCGAGTCVCGACQCPPGFSGSSCECPSTCPTFNDVICNGHGTCSCGACSCTGGYTGPSCQCPSGGSSACNPTCSSHGTCDTSVINVAIGVCTGICRCDPGYSGNDCNCQTICSGTSCGFGCDDATVGNICGTCNCGTCECAPGYDPAVNCTCKIGGCPISTANSLPCGGIGNLASDRATGCNCQVCDCKPSWTGPACDCSTEPCPDGCNGHGTCNCGTCSCSGSFAGSDCACPANAANNCVGPSGTCNGHGTCIVKAFQCGECECEPGYGGDKCSCLLQSCPFANNLPCNGHGTCNDCGSCTCESGWAGDACDCEIQSCPEDCSGHGVCLHENAVDCNVCKCDSVITPTGVTPLYSGADCNCSTSGCPRVNGVPCNFPLGGECAGCACACKPGYTGVDCSCKITPCETFNGKVCNNRGVCDICTGICACEDGWTDSGCTTIVPDPCRNHTCGDCLKKENCTWCESSNSCRHFEFTEARCPGALRPGSSCPTSGLTDQQKIGIGAGLGGGLAAIGIASLIGFKVYGMLMDKREWQNFEKNRQASQWRSDNNPLFQSSVTETENPLYMGGSAPNS